MSAWPEVVPAAGPRERAQIRGWAGAALLLIDVINPLDFVGGDQLYASALPAARRIAALKGMLRREGVPAVYVNDNFGCWDLGFRELVALHLRSANRGQPIIELLAPQAGDHFVLKPKHSGFYGTSLELLLTHLGARRLILTGFAANICVWFTANDAHMRGYRLMVPADCIAAEAADDTAYVLRQMQRVMDADTRPSTEL
jgi:nicotinamidase-related amidase